MDRSIWTIRKGRGCLSLYDIMKRDYFEGGYIAVTICAKDGKPVTSEHVYAVCMANPK